MHTNDNIIKMISGSVLTSTAEYWRVNLFDMQTILNSIGVRIHLALFNSAYRLFTFMYCVFISSTFNVRHSIDDERKYIYIFECILLGFVLLRFALLQYKVYCFNAASSNRNGYLKYKQTNFYSSQLQTINMLILWQKNINLISNTIASPFLPFDMTARNRFGTDIF